MSDSSRSALRLALSLADPATADALADRMKPQMLAVLTSGGTGLPGSGPTRSTSTHWRGCAADTPWPGPTAWTGR
ncbi:hypothetical protein SNOUR_39885 [Streptomyces noursei ATCC 11455]|uniref:hypothetical protein n=1 Tax=Streptomyces noursei TaxID=1971 RepID=UPI00081C4B20|nr:hypothetical protein SNOUR_39885 [Streptomyces noursei ATCC 11455]